MHPARPTPIAAPLRTVRLQTLTLALAGEQARFPLHLTDLSAMESQLRRDRSGTAFSIPPEASVRLIQFGNRPSSKQQQGAYALKVGSAGKIRIRVDPGAGRYGPGCFLCAQIYDAGHRFITQVRTPLQAGAGEQEVRLPDASAHICLSVELSGSGQLHDLTVSIVGPVLRGPSGLAFETAIRGPEDVRALLDAGAPGEKALREAALGRPGLLAAAALSWFYDWKYHDILALVRAAKPWRESAPETTGLLAYLLFFGARALANMNATRSAVVMLEELRSIEGWRDLLSRRDAQTASILHGHFQVRNGRPADGLAAFELARMEEPTHWEAYFQLANNLDDVQSALKDAYYKAAETLLGRPHPKLAVATVENDLRNGRWSDALSRALAAIAGLKQARDVWLALANVYLEVGDVASWRRYVGAYFEQYGLAPPQFEDGGAIMNGLSTGATAAQTVRAATGGGSVAVIVTTFNSAETLEFSVASVLRQTYRDIEVVIVDDLSSDGSRDVARRLAAGDSRVRVIENDANSGTFTCKNLALSCTEADFYTFHDSDDWMHPERIARHVEAMRETGAACTTSLWFRMNAEGRVTPRHAGGYQHSNPASIFVRRDVVDRLGYFDCVRTGADTEYVWRIRNVYGLENTVEIPLPLGVGLHHKASLTQSGATAFDRYRYSGVRLDYWESWVKWHSEALADGPEGLRLPFPAGERLFWAPPDITPEGGRRS